MPFSQPLRLYVVFGLTATVCEHCAVSEAEAAACSALAPPCGAVAVIEPRPPEQLQPDSVPVSKSPLASRLTVAAEEAPPITVTSPAAPATRAVAVASAVPAFSGRRPAGRADVARSGMVSLQCSRPAGGPDAVGEE